MYIVRWIDGLVPTAGVNCLVVFYQLGIQDVTIKAAPSWIVRQSSDQRGVTVKFGAAFEHLLPLTLLLSDLSIDENSGRSDQARLARRNVVYNPREEMRI